MIKIVYLLSRYMKSTNKNIPAGYKSVKDYIDVMKMYRRGAKSKAEKQKFSKLIETASK